MGKALEPIPAKLVLGVIASGRDGLDAALRLLEPEFGSTDLTSQARPFDFTDYYRREMGDDLWRCFHSFQRLVPLDSLIELKTLTNRLELETAEGGPGETRRRLNLDPGCLTGDQLVLATTKPARHRIYMGSGIFGDIELYYQGRSFNPWEWTYPDYRLAETVDFFNRVRSIYLEQCRGGSGT